MTWYRSHQPDLSALWPILDQLTIALLEKQLLAAQLQIQKQQRTIDSLRESLRESENNRIRADRPGIYRVEGFNTGATGYP